jgi:hypothetical protein
MCVLMIIALSATLAGCDRVKQLGTAPGHFFVV